MKINNKIADDLVWEMFTDSGGMAKSGQEYMDQMENANLRNWYIYNLNEITERPLFLNMWNRGIIDREFSITPLVDFLEEHPNLTDEELVIVQDLDQILEEIFATA